MGHRLEVASSLLATLAEQGRGVKVSGPGRLPKEPLELYDMEGCPYCRLVREALTELDLDVMIYPCPKGGLRYRPLVERLGGKQQFPFLMDPNTDTSLYESADIINYLYRTYGNGKVPSGRLRHLMRLTSSLGTSIVRARRGLHAHHNTAPKKPLELYSFETSPYGRLVRERLTELEIPYLLRQCGRTQTNDWLLPIMRKQFGVTYQPTQRNRKALMERTGRVAIPYLIDPNTNTEMFESENILQYLDEAYSS